MVFVLTFRQQGSCAVLKFTEQQSTRDCPRLARSGSCWAYQNHVTSHLTPTVEDAIFLRADLAEVAGVEATTLSESRFRCVGCIGWQIPGLCCFGV